MAAGVPTILLSSTYYDLNQVRADLFDFLRDQLGYNVLAFEQGSFPIDPDTSTIENCRRRVEHDTDVLVLIVGARYGYVHAASGKSVTNLEYLAARAKRIPIYVFLEKQMLAYYEAWRRNPENKFDGLVDNPKLFDFVRGIREVDNIWTVPFERAQDIVAALRAQFAFLLHGALNSRARLTQHPAQDELDGLRGRAFQIALERPVGWEYRLLSELLIRELDKHNDAKRDYDSGFVLGIGARVSLTNWEWVSDRINELSTLGEQWSKVINIELAAAVGAPGEHGSVSKIRHGARKLGEIYRFAIDWTQHVRRTHFPSLLGEAKEAMCKFASDIVRKLEVMSDELCDGVSKIDDVVGRGEKYELKINVVLEAVGIEEFGAAMNRTIERMRNGEPLDG